MRKLLRVFARDDRGQTLALMAIAVAGSVAMLSLAVDLGMLYTARSEAQRAAEAAALAGAQEFLAPVSPSVAALAAQDSAMKFALLNAVRNVPIDSSEVQITVDATNQLVRVRIHRDSVGLWFARMVGRNASDVTAQAAARAAPASAATCVAPWAFPDMWSDADDDTNGNRLWDPSETWVYGSDPGDYYLGFGSGSVSPPETGWGSPFRNSTGIPGDFGRQLTFEVEPPGGGSTPTSGFVYPFQIGGNSGALLWRAAIVECEKPIVPLNTSIPVEPAGLAGHTRIGVNNLINRDPTAYWDPSTNTVVSPVGWQSPRIRIVPLYDPSQTATVAGGGGSLTFNNFALVFVEGVSPSGPEVVTVRFLYYAQGLPASVPGNLTGSLVRVIQLVE